jgi:fringe-like protein
MKFRNIYIYVNHLYIKIQLIVYKDSINMVKVGIVVMATAKYKRYRDQIDACIDTWAGPYMMTGHSTTSDHDVSVRFFGGDHIDTRLVNLPDVKEDYQSAFHKQFGGLKWMQDNDPCDFYMVVGTDTYVNIEQLIQLLDRYDSTTDCYIGGHGDLITLDGNRFYYHCGGAGFILSSTTVEKIFKIWTPKQIYTIWDKACCRYKRNIRAQCDVTIAWICDLFLIEYSLEPYFNSCNYKGRRNNDQTECGNCGRRNPYTRGNCTENRIYYPAKLISCHLMEPPLMREYYEFLTYTPPTNVVDNWSLVTFFSKRDSLKLGQYVLSLPVKLVIFCDETCESELSEFRKQLKLDSYTDIIVIDHQKPKFDMIDEAINRSDSEFYGWVDIDIVKLVGNYPNQLIRAMRLYRKRISAGLFDYVPQISLHNTDELPKSIHTNFITGHKEYMCKLHQRTVDDKSNDHDRLLKAYIAHGDWFELYFSNQAQLLNNYDKLRVDPYSIISNVIVKARIHSDHSVSYKACKSVVDGMLNNGMYIDMDHLPTLIDDYYISAFYLKKDCLSILRLHNLFIEWYGDAYSKKIETIIEHLIRNTDYLYQRICHLTPKGPLAINGSPSKDIVDEYIADGYKVFIYGDYPLNVSSLVHNNPVYRPQSAKLGISYTRIIYSIFES